MTARIYDYYLGKDNYAVDREAAEEIMKAVPEAPASARANRGFLARAVRYLAADAGIRQFIDIGTGLPTQGNVHEIAQEVAPHARVVYVDHDHYKSGCSHTKVSAKSLVNVSPGPRWPSAATP